MINRDVNSCLCMWVLLCMFCSPSGAQERRKTYDRPQNYVKFDFSVSPNIDLIRTESGQGTHILSRRPVTVPSFAFRTTYLFSPKIGAYAGLRVDYFHEKKFKYRRSGKVDRTVAEFFEGLFAPIMIPHPAVDAGLVYRLEKGKWNIYPGVGVGFATYLHDRSRSSSHTNSQGSVHEYHYKQKGAVMTINGNVTVTYFVIPRGYILFNAAFQQPLDAPYASIRELHSGVEISKRTYRNPTAGRIITAGIGYGVILVKKKR